MWWIVFVRFTIKRNSDKSKEILVNLDLFIFYDSMVTNLSLERMDLLESWMHKIIGISASSLLYLDDRWDQRILRWIPLQLIEVLFGFEKKNNIKKFDWYSFFITWWTFQSTICFILSDTLAKRSCVTILALPRMEGLFVCLSVRPVIPVR